MTLLVSVFGEGTVYANGVLSVPLSNFTCTHQPRYLLGSMVVKLFLYANNTLVDSDGVPLLTEWNDNIITVNSYYYECNVVKSYDTVHLVRQYNVIFKQ